MMYAKKLIYTTIPLLLLGFIGTMYRLFKGNKQESSKERIKEVMNEAVDEIDIAVNELKSTIENKTATQLKKALDSAIENAKRKFDIIASELKSRIREVQINERKGGFQAQCS